MALALNVVLDVTRESLLQANQKSSSTRDVFTPITCKGW